MAPRRALWLLGLSVLCAPFAEAAGKKKKPPPVPPSSGELLTPLPPKPAGLSQSSKQLYERMREAHAALEYDQVIPLGEELLKREDLTIEQRVETYRLYGSAKAVVEDPLEAEKPFRMLLRFRPEADLPADTPPKIMAVFRKVQSEERALSQQLREVERARVIKSLKLLGDLPTHGTGGQPLKFSFRLKDPQGSVEAIRVAHRRAGQSRFSTLALMRSESGEWNGFVPSEVTADEKGFTLDYFVETLDAAGPLLTLGDATHPNHAEISAGAVVTAVRPKPLPKWLFVTTASTAGALGLASGGLGFALQTTQADYQARGQRPEIDGADLSRRARQGEMLAQATNAALISAAAAAVATGVIALFTDFNSAPP